MNKIIAVALSSALALSFATPAQAAAPKASAKCSSVSAVYEDLVCTKIKNKKVWTVQKFVQWSTNFNLVAMSNASQANFTKWVSSHKAPTQAEYYTDISDRRFLKSYLYSANSVEAINPNAKLFFSSTEQSTRALMDANHTSYNLNNGILCYSSPGVIGCNMLDNTGIVILNGASHSIFSESVLPHENFHSVQSYLGKYDGRVHRALPVWFVEGSADYFGYMSYANANNKKYSSIRSSIDRGPETTGMLAEYDSYSKYPYNIGRVAVEYLVASKGFDAVVQVFADYGNGISFENSFEKTFDISLKEFYTKFKEIKNNVSGLVK